MNPTGPDPGGLGLYVHVPYCRQRCTYCDFVTYVPGDSDHAADDVRRYSATVRREVRLLLDRFGPVAALDSLYLGGGTPTLLGVDALGEVIGAVREVVGVSADAEVTVEANPETLDDAMLEALAELGVTRLSIGMQSFDPAVLHILGRTHSPDRPLQAVGAAHAAGIPFVSIDLIYATDGESRESWQRTLDAVIASGVDHVSAYGLIVERRTALARLIASGEVAAPDDEVAAERYLQADAALAAAGFSWYELSNWSRVPQARSRHNQRYWRGGSWLAIGPGAWGQMGQTRWRVEASPRRWRAAIEAGESAWTEVEHLDDSARRLEAVMLGLRTSEGIAHAGFEIAVVDDLVARGWVVFEADRVRLTAQGRLFANRVIDVLTDSML